MALNKEIKFYAV